MSTENPEVKGKILPRREFLRFLAGVGLGAFVGSLSSPQRSHAYEDPGLPEAKTSFADKIRTFEIELGSKPLAFEQARLILPELAGVYTTTFKRRLTQDEFVSSTIIVEGNLPDDQKKLPDDSPVLLKLRERYPGINLTPKLKDAISSGVDRSLGSFLNDEGLILIFLDNINNLSNQNPNARRYTGSWEDLKEGGVPTPVEIYRSVFLHEADHKEEETQWAALKDDTVSAMREAGVKICIDDPLARFYMGNFNIRRERPDMEYSKYDTYLNEALTDYRGMSVSLSSGLSVSDGYANCRDLANFDVLLKEAGITWQELEGFLSDSKLEEFLIRTVQAIKNPGIDTKDPRHALSFGLKLFSQDGLLRLPNWQTAQKYFPGVTLTSTGSQPVVSFQPDISF